MVTTESVLEFIRKAFSDFVYFDDLLSEALCQFISEQLIAIDCMKENYPLEASSPETDFLNRFFSLDGVDKKIMKTIKIIFTATRILIVSYSAAAVKELWSDTATLLEKYPEFSANLASTLIADRKKEEDKELKLLLRFRNFMRLGLLLVPGRPKLFLLRVVERLEGSDNYYITGTGQKSAVTRREAIYVKEGGNEPQAKKRLTKAEAAKCESKKQKVEIVTRDSFEELTSSSCMTLPAGFDKDITLEDLFRSACEGHFDSFPFPLLTPTLTPAGVTRAHSLNYPDDDNAAPHPVVFESRMTHLDEHGHGHERITEDLGLNGHAGVPI